MNAFFLITLFFFASDRPMGVRETIEVSSSKFYLGGMDGTSEVQILGLTGELLEYDNDKKNKMGLFAKERKMDEFISTTDPLPVRIGYLCGFRL
jgi:hypothetical protein